MVKIITLYLSTTTVRDNMKPIDKTNLANVKWNINWREVFNEYIDMNKPCRVKCKLITNTASNINPSNVLGTLRCNFSSAYSSINNGFVLAPVSWKYDTLNNQNYIDIDTVNTNGETMIIPSNGNFFNVYFLKPDESTLMSVIPEYQLMLYFEIDELDEL